MNCPQCYTPLEQAMIGNTTIDYCSRCYGMWFDKGELQSAKDSKDRDLRWFDIDLWKNPLEFRARKGARVCPRDRFDMYEVEYGGSGVKVDVCGICEGVWLDRGEFKKIVAYLKDKADAVVLYNYLESLKKELWEVFSGPEILRDEVYDFLAILKLLRYKFAAQHPVLSSMMLSLPA